MGCSRQEQQSGLPFLRPGDLSNPRIKLASPAAPVIMGRKTFESIGRALPGRVNIVISRGFSTGEEVDVVGSLEEAFKVAESTNLEKCFVMGGGQIYAQALEVADRLIVTHVHTVIEDADTFFPSIDPSVWSVADRSELQSDPETGYTFEFVEYVKR